MSQSYGGVPVELAARTVGEALILLRHRARLSRDQVADMAEVAGGTLSRLEKDVGQSSAGILREVVKVLAGATNADYEALWAEIGRLLDDYRA